MDEYTEAAKLQQTLVDELLAKKCVTDPQVEAAFRSVPRHLFLPHLAPEEAYVDRALKTKVIDETWVSSSSQPAMMAIMLEQLALAPGQRVLEIGAGTGFNAALMAHIVGETGQVVTIDIDDDLVESAQQHLAVAGYEQVLVLCTDGGYGYPDAAPYDRIILTVGAADITLDWWRQLKVGGRLVLPLAINQGQQAMAFDKIAAQDEPAATDVVNDERGTARPEHLLCRSSRPTGFIRLRGEFAEASPSSTEIGSEPGLTLAGDTPAPVGGEQIVQWMMGESRDWDSGVMITLRDIPRSLALWLQLLDRPIVLLAAKGAWLERKIIPALSGVGGPAPEISTGGLISSTGLALFARAPGESAPFSVPEKWPEQDEPFRLHIRQYGQDERLVQELILHIQAWEAAGRPGLDEATIRIFQQSADYAPSEQTVVLYRQHTKIVIGW